MSDPNMVWIIIYLAAVISLGLAVARVRPVKVESLDKAREIQSEIDSNYQAPEPWSRGRTESNGRDNP